MQRNSFLAALNSILEDHRATYSRIGAVLLEAKNALNFDGSRRLKRELQRIEDFLSKREKRHTNES
jgi:hypothetical protein